MLKILINPFEKLQENQLLSIGIFVMLIGSFIGGTLNARFDGFLDLHFTHHTNFAAVILDNLINTTTSIIILFGLGKHINSKTRLIDIITTILIARIPFYILPIFNISGDIIQASDLVIALSQNQISIEDIPQFTFVFFIVFAIFTLMAIVWVITLLYNGFKTACNTKTTTHIIMFAAGVLLSEVISKTLIILFNVSI